MKTKFGAIIVDGSGKLGGHVVAKNRGGSYMRTKTTPINPQSAHQTTIRNRMSVLSTGWGALTQPQRDLWNKAVSAFKKTDIFGDIKSPSGFNLYVKLNCNLALVGVAAIVSPPSPIALPSFTTATLAAATGAQTLALTYLPTPVPAGVAIVIECTPAMNPGKSFVKNDFRYVSKIAAAGASPFAAGVAYIARLGAIGSAGKVIWMRITTYSITTGQKGIPIVISAIIAA